MNATNNPYMLLPPPTDTTLTQEGVAADAKAVGDALNNKNALIQEGNVDNVRTDSNGNIYTDFSTEKYVILQAWSLGACVTPFITGDYKWAFHFWNWNSPNIGDYQLVSAWYRYYLR